MTHGRERARSRLWVRLPFTQRVLLPYVVVFMAFLATTFVLYTDAQSSLREAHSLRRSLVPLQLVLGETLGIQGALEAQLDSPLTDLSKVDRTRQSQLRAIEEARVAIGRLTIRGVSYHLLWSEVQTALDAVEDEVTSLEPTYLALAEALEAQDSVQSAELQRELLAREGALLSTFTAMRLKVDALMSALDESAAARRSRTVILFGGLSGLTLLLAIVASILTRRLLQPLREVSVRAVEVSGGDLTPRRPIRTDDSEIGQLRQTFETMVSALRDAREKLLQVERLAAIGKIAAHITHEIRNPLNSIGLNLELLESEPLSPEALELVVSIKAETYRLARLSEQYLSLARRPTPEVRLEQITDLLDEVLEFLGPELSLARIDVRTVVVVDPPPIFLDENLFRQCLLNLIQNAKEAMVGGGELTLRVGGDADWVVLDLEDTGLGIPPEVKSHVFDPFFTTKAHGTGLGLAVTREIIEAHGGDVTCTTNEPSTGTRFTLRFPKPPKSSL